MAWHDSSVPLPPLLNVSVGVPIVQPYLPDEAYGHARVAANAAIFYQQLYLAQRNHCRSEKNFKNRHKYIYEFQNKILDSVMHNKLILLYDLITKF